MPESGGAKIKIRELSLENPEIAPENRRHRVSLVGAVIKGHEVVLRFLELAALEPSQPAHVVGVEPGRIVLQCPSEPRNGLVMAVQPECRHADGLAHFGQIGGLGPL